MGCIVPYDPSPEVASRNFTQLPGDNDNGKSPRARHYVVRHGTLVIARVLVTGSDAPEGYDVDTEYWRWRIDALEPLRAGERPMLSFELQPKRLQSKAEFDVFEGLTHGWAVWECARTFTLEEETVLLSTSATNTRFVYQVESSEYGHHPGHYFELQFARGHEANTKAPEVHWYLASGLGTDIGTEKAQVFVERAALRLLANGRVSGHPLVPTH